MVTRRGFLGWLGTIVMGICGGWWQKWGKIDDCGLVTNIPTAKLNVEREKSGWCVPWGVPWMIGQNDEVGDERVYLPIVR